MTQYTRSSFAAVALVGFAALSCQPPALQVLASDSLQAHRGQVGQQAHAEVALEAAKPTANAEELAVLAYLWGRHTGLSRSEENALATTLVSEAVRHEMEPSMVLAVIQVESGGYHLAVSPVGALGLMQLLPSTAEELAHKLEIDWRGPDTLFDPVTNVTLGIAYLKQLSDRYGSFSTALAAYNWGPGRIDRRLRKGVKLPSLYPEQVTRAYERVTRDRS
jgi:soluble lytic murein transglycosylase